jgi:hypothetical protein
VSSFLPDVQLASFSACPREDYLVAMSVEVNLEYKLAKEY